jgi:hypothetical protein
VPWEAAISETFRWIKAKHNDYSRDILANPAAVRKEINRQANRIYSEYQLPDETHNTFWGWVAKADLKAILHFTDASLPKARFWYSVVKYCYPRRMRKRLGVRRDLLVQWSNERPYLSRIEEMTAAGVLRRGSAYCAGAVSKALQLNWDWQHPENAILVDGRAPDTFEETLAAAFSDPEELRAVLLEAGMNRRVVLDYLGRVYRPSAHDQPPELDSADELGNVLRFAPLRAAS